jgi:hypothetical protein
MMGVPIRHFLEWARRLVATGQWVWNPGISRTYDEAVAFDLIDTRIAGLVASLNIDEMVATTFSCEGHGYHDDASVIEYRYVGFQADIGFAALLNRALTDASPIGSGRLHLHWSIGYGGGPFILRAHFPQRRTAGLRQQLDEDFATISGLVGEITGAQTA